MERPIVTFFVPCYNVTGCVEKCFKSILDAGLGEKVEILAVNDGSKDNTLELLRKYESEYPNIIRVIDKPNGGWGTAVNKGIAEAKGVYFKELDADDWVDTENLPQYVSGLEKLDCDYVATNFSNFMDQTKTIVPRTFQKDIYGQVLELNDFWDKYPDGWHFPIHAITYKTDFIRRIGLKVGDRYYSDFEYFMYSMPYVGKICVLDINVTMYFRGSDEQSTGVKGYTKNYRDFVAMTERLIAFYKQIPEKTHLGIKNSIRNTILGNVGFAYELMMSPVYAGKKEGVKEELKAFDKRIKNEGREFYGESGNRKKKGIKYIKIWRITGINLLKL